MNATLHRYILENVTLNQAVKDLKPPQPSGGGYLLALLSSPRRFFLARWRSESGFEAGSSRIPLDAVYEARIASPEGELRWLHEGEGRGRAVRWSRSAFVDPPNAVGTETISTIGDLERSYLLWGEPHEKGQSPEGFSQLSSARIGVLEVPIEGARGRVRLRAREYLAEDEHGNSYVLEELLEGLEVLDA